MNQKLLWCFFSTVITPCALAMTKSVPTEQTFIQQETHSPVFNDLNHASNLKEAEGIINDAIRDLSNQTGLYFELIRDALLVGISAKEIREKTEQELKQLITEIKQGHCLRVPRMFRSPSGPSDDHFNNLVIMAGYLGLMY